MNVKSYKNSLYALSQVNHIVAQGTQQAMQTIIMNTNTKSLSADKRFTLFGTFSGSNPELAKSIPYGFHIGGAAHIIADLYAGIAYSYGYQSTKEYTVTTAGPETKGSAKGRFHSHHISGIVLWNLNKPGFTSFIEYSLGRGNALLSRSFIVDKKTNKNKGKTHTNTNGLTARIGYTLQSSEVFSTTPYAEVALVQAGCNNYTEHHGQFLARISGIKEQVLEKRLGLDNTYKITKSTELQFWAAAVESKKNSSSKIHAKIPQNNQKVTLPKHSKKEVSGELGASLSLKITDNVGIRFYGSVQTKHSNTGLQTQSAGTSIWYSF